MIQVITIHPDGTMSGLQRKPKQGVDLRQFGHAEIRRASEIVWDDMEQAWFVTILRGPSAGENITPFHCDDAGLGTNDILALAPSAKIPTKMGMRIWFAEYDEAVKVEIAVLDGMRLKGVL